MSHGFTDAPAAVSAVSNAFSVHKGGTNQTGIVSGAVTVVTFSTELFDTDGDFASNAFTPTTAGKYSLHAHATFTVGSAGSLYQLIIDNVGAGGTRLGEVIVRPHDTSSVTMVLSGVVDANGTTDSWQVKVFQNSGSDKILSGQLEATAFSGAYVGE